MKFGQILSAAVLVAMVGSVQAHGDVSCDTPKAEWKPQMALRDKLVSEGWRVRRVLESNGCYEVYGFDPKGERTEAFFDPKSFERVMPKE